jgi:hypothetical protein
MPRTRLDPDALRDALESACLDEMRGDPPGPLLAGRLHRACTTVLRGLGVRGARVEARSDRGGTAVRVVLPPGVASVQQVVLTLGGG